MNRTHNFKKTAKLIHQDVSRKIAIHEAGHASAIYLGNNKKGLPPVYFEIFIQTLPSDFQSGFLGNPSEQYIAKVQGGLLIHTLPSSFDEATQGFSSAQKLAFQQAFEADIINLMVGPLAEANYVALRDNEPINPQLVNVNALQYYGGLSDLKIVNEYLECLIDCDELREWKLTDLFLAAFSFVRERSNWLAITTLADYILAANRKLIEYDEIIGILGSVSEFGKQNTLAIPQYVQ